MGDNRSMEISHEESVLQNIILVISRKSFENHPNDPKFKTFYDDLDKRKSSPDQEKRKRWGNGESKWEREACLRQGGGVLPNGTPVGGKEEGPYFGNITTMGAAHEPVLSRKGLAPSPLSLSCCEAQLWYGVSVPLNETLCCGLHNIHARGMLTSVWEPDGNKYFHLRTHKNTLTVISSGGSSWCPCPESIFLPKLLLRWSFCFHEHLS